MSEFPKVIYLHDGQDEITWSEHEEVEGVKYFKAYPLVRQDFEQWARAAGFNDFCTDGHGCYEDSYLAHAYLGWCAASPKIEPAAYLMRWDDGEEMLKFNETDWPAGEEPNSTIPLIPIYY